MKKKLSISIEEQTINKLESLIKSGYFRNKSHLIEFSVNKFLEEQYDKKKSN